MATGQSSKPTSLYRDLPATLEREVFEQLLSHAGSLRIERILSRGQCSPPEEWYDQDEHEWILLVEGAAAIGFEDGIEVRLQKGDYLNIPRRQKHRVLWTDPDRTTIWLAIFYR